MWDNPATRIIASAIIGVAFFTFIMTLMPTIPLPDIIGNSFEWAIDLLWSFNFIFPVQTMWSVVSLMIYIEIIIAGIKLALWIKNQLTSVNRA